jgi:hypothetical protein
VTAAALVREARTAGLELRLVAGAVKVRGQPEPDLLARLRGAKPEVTAILKGDACRTCGVPLAWPRALGVVFADGTAECMRCCDHEAERLLASGQRAGNPDLASDPAELMLQPGGQSRPTTAFSSSPASSALWWRRLWDVSP